MHSRPTLICLALIALAPRALPAVTINYSAVIARGSELDGQPIRVADGPNGPSYVVIESGVSLESLTVSENSSVVMMGGIVGGSVNVHTHASFTMLAGDINNVSAVGPVQVHIADGLITGRVLLQATRNTPGLPQAVISGGVFEETVFISAGRLLITGGDFQRIQPQSVGSTLEVTGGKMTAISAWGESVVHYSGGEITGQFDINVYQAATVHVYGSNLVYDRGISRLDGVLADGTVMNNYDAYVTQAGRLVLHNAPEPSAFMLMFTTAIPCALCWRCRSRVKTGIA